MVGTESLSPGKMAFRKQSQPDAADCNQHSNVGSRGKKEANEVILILGCDANTGKGAADWAGSKPNILNVALTRAKYRIAIIGDSDVWKEVPYFNIAYERLPKEVKSTISHSTRPTRLQ
jgi:hypothetical protein